MDECRNPTCKCEVEEGQEFCSPYCESGAGSSVPTEPCQCGHSACVAASYP